MTVFSFARHFQNWLGHVFFKPVRFFTILSLFVLVQALPAWARGLTILHTNDLHSYLEGMGPDSLYSPQPNGDPVRGGLGRMITLIQQERVAAEAQGDAVLVLDAGDFFSGTLFHILSPSSDSLWTPELEFFSLAGYDAVTLGNHDFDAGSVGLARMIKKARRQGIHLPLLSANLDIKSLDDSLLEVFEDSRSIPQATRLQPALLKTVSIAETPVRVGIIGLMAPTAIQVSSNGRKGVRLIGFDDKEGRLQEDAFHALARREVETLRREHGAEIVIVLLHGGNPEDAALVEHVPGIDVVVAGHNHEKLSRFHKGVPIGQAGNYGEALGVMRFLWKGGRLQPESEGETSPLTHRMITDVIPADESFSARSTLYKNDITRIIQSEFAYNTPVIRVEKDFRRSTVDLFRDPLGVAVASWILQALNRHVSEPIDVLFTSLALVRSEFRTAEGQPVMYQFSDIFKFFSVGYDDRGRPGSPLVSFYLTVDDLKLLIRFSTFYSRFNPLFTPITSHTLTYKNRWWGIPLLNRVGDFFLHGESLEKASRLIHVVCNGIVGEQILKMRQTSRGILSITPRDREGKALTRLSPLEVPSEAILLAEALRSIPGGTLPVLQSFPWN